MRIINDLFLISHLVLICFFVRFLFDLLFLFASLHSSHRSMRITIQYSCSRHIVNCYSQSKEEQETLRSKVICKFIQFKPTRNNNFVSNSRKSKHLLLQIDDMQIEFIEIFHIFNLDSFHTNVRPVFHLEEFDKNA